MPRASGIGHRRVVGLAAAQRTDRSATATERAHVVLRIEEAVAIEVVPAP
jgi:hypothetical protein